MKRTVRNVRSAALLALVLGGAWCGAGCGADPGVPGSVSTGQDRPDLELMAHAFAPVALRIDPLTHVGLGEGGEPRLVCHIELTDRWGDTAKAVGELQVQLYRAGAGLDEGRDVQELSWDVDLTDLEQNAALFDPVTKSYRLQLVDVPEWVAAMARGEAGRARLRAVLTTVGPRGRELVLRDDFVIQ